MNQHESQTSPPLVTFEAEEPRFRYEPLTAQHIRVLRIEPADTRTDQISVTLEENQLKSGISYDCLSYTWDGSRYSDEGEHWTTNHQRIICSGAMVHIRQNLHDALWQLRDLDMLGPIWIDALCINQEDILERNSQVSQMKEIYQGANRVVVWLGKEHNNTKRAIAYLNRSNLSIEDYDKDEKLGLLEYQRCQYTEEEVQTIAHFTADQRFYSRLWIIQEVVLARDLIFLCGSNYILLETIWRGVLFIRYLNLPTLKAILLKTKDTTTMNFLQIGLWRSRLLSREFGHPASLRPIAYSLYAFRTSVSTDPRDKVFGLLGISDCYDSTIQQTLVADYNMSIQDVYIDAAQFSMLFLRNQSALAMVGDPSRNNVKGLPSWVADLSVPELPPAFEHEVNIFSAATREQVTLGFNGDALILEGAFCDEIWFTSESPAEITQGKGVFKLLRIFMMFDFVHSKSSDREPLVRTLQRVFIADQLHPLSSSLISTQEIEYDLEDALATLLFRLICFALKKAGQPTVLQELLDSPRLFLQKVAEEPGEHSVWQRLIEPTWEGLTSIINRGRAKFSQEALNMISSSDYDQASIYDALGINEDPFAADWYAKFSLRRYFLTSSGRLGLGIHHIQPGDSIYLIKGASVPYVFRPVSDNPEDEFKLIGEVYVHGIMYGEALVGEPVEFERMVIH